MESKAKHLLSIVVTCYNEEDNVKPMVEAIHNALSGMNYEIILVDDGSTDQTIKNILTLNDDVVHLVKLKRNYGQTSALSAGIQYAHGAYIITMDGDLQNDPADIPNMMDVSLEGDWDIVAGVRANRQDKLFIRKMPSKIANFIIRSVLKVDVKDNGCALKVFKADVAKEIPLYGEFHRLISILAILDGASFTQVNVNHHARIHGTSKYGLSRIFKVIADLILLVFFKKWMQKPMHLFGFTGIAIFTIGVFINMYLLVLKFMGQDIWGKPLLLLGVLLILFGFQLISTGIVTEFLLRTYYESQDKFPYQVKQIFVGNELSD